MQSAKKPQSMLPCKKVQNSGLSTITVILIGFSIKRIYSESVSKSCMHVWPNVIQYKINLFPDNPAACMAKCYSMNKLISRQPSCVYGQVLFNE